MDEALKGPTYTLPNGLSSDEIIAYICKAANAHNERIERVVQQLNSEEKHREISNADLHRSYSI